MYGPGKYYAYRCSGSLDEQRAPAHSIKVEAAKAWSGIGSTTVRSYAEKRITSLRQLAAVGASDILLDCMAPRPLVDKNMSEPLNQERQASKKAPKYW